MDHAEQRVFDLFYARISAAMSGYTERLQSRIPGISSRQIELDLRCLEAGEIATGIEVENIDE